MKLTPKPETTMDDIYRERQKQVAALDEARKLRAALTIVRDFREALTPLRKKRGG